MYSLREWRRRRLLRQFPLADELWSEVTAGLPVLDGLDDRERERLRALATIFLQEKTFEPVQGLEMTPRMRLCIAAQASLPVLHLGLDWLRGWSAVIVYPGEFVHRREEVDEAGIVHEWDEVRGGESWEYGPVILSWADVSASGQRDGYNVVIHELAHKLDMLNGEPNGFPPLPRRMDVHEWNRVFSAAYADLNSRLDGGEDTSLDPYAAEHPAEFFAVLSEYFFETPRLVQDAYPAVYAQLRAFYRQDPLRRAAPPL
jgi:Mlc titration factor MtfA (ptsG expression regulator)